MSITLEGAPEIRARFDRIASDQTKTRLLMRIAKEVISSSKKRVRAQTDLNNSAFTPRKNSRRKKKMLIKVGQSIRQVNANANEVKVGFSARRTETIAAKQQFGFTQQFTPRQAASSPSAERPTAPATRRQAKALLEAGFKIRRPRGGYKTPTLKWITEHMTRSQASLVLKELRPAAAKTNWKTVLPPRSFLGVTATELTALNQLALNEMKTILGI